MNDMFNDLKELKQKLKTEENAKQKTQSAKKSQKTTTASDKESRLKSEFKEFMKEAYI
ncbi:MAG: hypothetical protein LBJ88_03550 [Campylobacteraceae bacterium]|nr:hypothetical protein [Campylobacteraceae bacterium]